MARYAEKKAKKAYSACDRWKKYMHESFKLYDEQMEFVLGEQWDKNASDLLMSYQKTPMTANKLASIALHLLGEQQRNTANIEVIPGKGVTASAANLREALVKDISFESHAKAQYQMAFKQLLIGGISALHQTSRYVDSESFNQEIIIKAFKDPTKTFFDVGAPDDLRQEGQHCGFETAMTRDAFASKFGEKVAKKIDKELTYSDNVILADKKMINVFTTYWRETEHIELVMLSNNRVVEANDFKELERQIINDIEVIIDMGEPVYVKAKRTAERYKIKYSVFAGYYELDSGEVKGLGILPMQFGIYMPRITKDNKEISRPFFVDAQNPQQFINYIVTQITYLIKISRYDQFIGSKENVRSQDTIQNWKDPLTVRGMITFDESRTGVKPEQLRPPELPIMLTQQYERAINDIQQATGVYDTQLGQGGNEVSGVAVDKRTERSSFVVYTAHTTLHNMIWGAAQTINKMIPAIYDTEREMTLDLAQKGRQQIVLNERLDDYNVNPDTDMTTGDYKIKLANGPSMEGQKQQLRDAMETLFKYNPSYVQLLGDLFADNLDAPNMNEIKNRIRAQIPEEIIESGESGKPLPPKPPQPTPQEQADIALTVAKIKEIDAKIQKLQADTQVTQGDHALEVAKLIQNRQQMAEQLQKSLLDYEAETHRTDTDESINRTNAMVDLLTSNKGE
jgi:hypothetical protein